MFISNRELTRLQADVQHLNEQRARLENEIWELRADLRIVLRHLKLALVDRPAERTLVPEKEAPSTLSQLQVLCGQLGAQAQNPLGGIL